MKIALYSDEKAVVNKDADIASLNLVNKKYSDIKFGYVPSSSDKDRKHFNHTKDYWSKYGINDYVFYSLDDEYNERSIKRLNACDIVYLSGGNTFRFLFSIKERKFDKFLRSYLLKGGVVIGISAGAMVLTPTIRFTYEYHKYRGDLEGLNTDNLKDLSGIGIVKFEFIPHVDEENKSNFIRTVGYNYSDYPKYHVADGGAVIINGSEIRCFGKVIMK